MAYSVGTGSATTIYMREFDGSTWLVPISIGTGGSPSICLEPQAGTGSRIHVFFSGGGNVYRRSRDPITGAWSSPVLLGTGYSASTASSWALLFRASAVWLTGNTAPYAINTYTPGLPATASLLSPANQATGQGTSNNNAPGAVSVTLSWQQAAEAEQYHVQVNTNSSFNGTSKLDLHTTGLSAAAGNLDGGTTYYWRVAGKNYIGEGTPAVRSFTTTATLLTAPQLTLPADNNGSLPQEYTFTWGTAPGATAYKIQISRNAADWLNYSIKDWETSSGSDTSLFVNFNGLYSTVLYWRVATKNGLGLGPYSAIRTFTTCPHPPGIDITSGYTVNGQGHPVITWQAFSTTGPYSIWRRYCANGTSQCDPWGQIDGGFSGPTGSYTDLSAYVLSKTAISNSYYYYQIRNNTYSSNQVGFKTVTNIEKTNIMPTATNLAGAYPNPFNPQTRIEFGLTEPGFVTLTVYNMLGQEMARLVSGRKDAGGYAAAWDAVDEPSGIYVVRMNVTDESGKIVYTASKKLMLVR